jgi:hypothetical protein
MTNQTPTRNTGNCSPVNQLYQKLHFFYGGRDVGCTSFQTLRPNHAGKREVTSTRKALATPYPTLKVMTRERGGKDYHKVGRRVTTPTPFLSTTLF